MRRTALLAAPLLLLAACSSSTLSADDQALCSEQEDQVAYGRQAVEEMVDGDRHWSSDGEPYAVSTVAIDPAYSYLTSRTPADPTLARLTDDAGKAMLSVNIYMPDQVFDNDAQIARDALAALDDLQTFCDDNG